MRKLRTRKEVLEIVQDNGCACVDRGEAIVELIESHMMSQAAIADETKLSTVTISHLKTCVNLKGTARAMCKAGKMNGDACYSLAKAPVSDQERILGRALQLRREKDSQRVLRTGPKGRQTRPEQITDEDIKEAIEDRKAEGE